MHVRIYVIHVRVYAIHVRVYVIHVRVYILHVHVYVIHVRVYVIHVRVYTMCDMFLIYIKSCHFTCAKKSSTEISTIVDPSATKNYPSATGSIIVGISARGKDIVLADQNPRFKILSEWNSAVKGT